MNSKQFIIVTWDKYPEGDAGSVRTHSFAKLLLSIGYNPIVIGMGSSSNFEKKTYDGVEYFSLRYMYSNKLCRIGGRLLFLHNLKRVLSKIDEIDGILIVSANENAFRFCKRLSLLNSIPLLYDAVEWYSPCEFKSGKLNYNYILNNRINTRIIDSSFKVVSISSYLNEYFNNRSITSIRIPVMLDVQKIEFEITKNDDLIRIVYAGTMGTKDYIHLFIKALELYSSEQLIKLRFDIIGSSLKTYEKMYGVIKPDLINRVIYFHDRLPRERVLSVLKNADFSVLIRPASERFSKAGFPTKICESFATGTSVIANISSDLDKYLNDSNSIIIEESVTSCREAIDKLLKMKISDIQSLKMNSRKTAELYFDWRNYGECLKGLLNK